MGLIHTAVFATSQPAWNKGTADRIAALEQSGKIKTVTLTQKKLYGISS